MKIRRTTKFLGAVVLLAFFTIAYWGWTPDKSWEELEATYLEDSADISTVLGNQMHVRDRGPKDAPAVILIHGFASSLQTFEGWQDRLKSEFRVISIDLPGSGLSRPDSARDYSDERSIALIKEIMDQLGIARATLAGNSIGGRISWRFAGVHPDRVDKLVLIAPDGFASDGFEYGKAPEIPAMTNIMKVFLPRYLIEENLTPAHGDPSTMTPDMVKRYHDLLIGPGTRQAVIDRMAQTVLIDPVPILKTINVPVLLLWGEKDNLIPASHALDYSNVLSDSRTVVLPELGHVPQEENPAQSLDPVRAFLNE